MRTKRLFLMVLLVLGMALQGLVAEAAPQEKIFRYSSVMAAANVNPHQASSSYDEEMSLIMSAGLFRFVPGEDKNTAHIAPELAAAPPIKMDEDGKVWQIKISPEAKWHNGDPINADTFIYSWKIGLDPVLLNPPCSSLAIGFIEIEKAQDYYVQKATGKEVKWEEVGIKKIDDLTLEIRTTQKYNADDVMKHFWVRCTKPVYEKMYEQYMNAERTATLYGTDAEKMMSSGPLALKDWVKGSERVFVRNPNYIHANEIKLDGINVRIIGDAGTAMQMFETGQLDYLFLTPSQYEKYMEDPRTIVYASRIVRQIEINRTNPKHPILGNLKFRQALYFAQDRKTMAELGRQKAAAYYVATNDVAYADGTKFRDIPGVDEFVPPNDGYDPKKAVKLFNEALAEVGIKKVSLTLNYYDTREDVKMMAEYQQKSLADLFGSDKFELKLQAMPVNQLFDTMKNHVNDPASFELSWAAWSLAAADFMPNRAFEFFQSDHPRRNAPYGNKEFDHIYKESIGEEIRLDEKKRAEHTKLLEKILIEDVMIVPIFEVINKVMFAERVITPVETFQSGFNWGFPYIDIQ